MNYRGGNEFIAQDFSWAIDFSKREKFLLYEAKNLYMFIFVSGYDIYRPRYYSAECVGVYNVFCMIKLMSMNFGHIN